jgi:hypothetical protein
LTHLETADSGEGSPFRTSGPVSSCKSAHSKKLRLDSESTTNATSHQGGYSPRRDDLPHRTQRPSKPHRGPTAHDISTTHHQVKPLRRGAGSRPRDDEVGSTMSPAHRRRRDSEDSPGRPHRRRRGRPWVLVLDALAGPGSPPRSTSCTIRPVHRAPRTPAKWDRRLTHHRDHHRHALTRLIRTHRTATAALPNPHDSSAFTHPLSEVIANLTHDSHLSKKSNWQSAAIDRDARRTFMATLRAERATG